MKTGVYFCNCGSIISDKIDSEKVKEKLNDAAYFKTCELMCSDEGKEYLHSDLKVERPDRIVIAACSPRDHEMTFMNVAQGAEINPYLMQMVNIREQIAWVVEDKDKAIVKTARYIQGAIKRVTLHKPLNIKEIDASTNVLIIGAGPAGLKAAHTIAEAGRKVILVEKTPAIGGKPVLYEKIFPIMECGPCMLEPMLDDVLFGRNSENIETLTISEVIEVTGYYGNFTVKIRQSPRYVNLKNCIGCMECIEPCPQKAIAFPRTGAMPNSVFINDLCLRTKGDLCQICKDACPIPDTIDYDDKELIHERGVGAIIIAIGSGLYDCSYFPNLGYGTLRDIYTADQFERLISSTGPTEGRLQTDNGTEPETFAIIHCVGSLDSNHKGYCSEVCCQYAFKFNQEIKEKLPQAHIYHIYKELALPGKDGFILYDKAKDCPDTTFIRYNDIKDIIISDKDAKKSITIKGFKDIESDMVVLCPAIAPTGDSIILSKMLDTTLDRFGFFEELHGRCDSAQSKIRGIYLAGACQSPMDIQSSMNQGMASASYILSGIIEGKKLEIDPIVAVLDSDRCAGCKVCQLVCPYKAIGFDEKDDISTINELLCHGCGTCVAACPLGAIDINHFTTEEIFAEIEGLLI
jgi:heterodisulfide reductase subunit A